MVPESFLGSLTCALRHNVPVLGITPRWSGTLSTHRVIGIADMMATGGR